MEWTDFPLTANSAYNPQAAVELLYAAHLERVTILENNVIPWYGGDEKPGPPPRPVTAVWMTNFENFLWNRIFGIWPSILDPRNTAEVDITTFNNFRNMGYWANPYYKSDEANPLYEYLTAAYANNVASGPLRGIPSVSLADINDKFGQEGPRAVYGSNVVSFATSGNSFSVVMDCDFCMRRMMKPVNQDLVLGSSTWNTSWDGSQFSQQWNTDFAFAHGFWFGGYAMLTISNAAGHEETVYPVVQYHLGNSSAEFIQSDGTEGIDVLVYSQEYQDSKPPYTPWETDNPNGYTREVIEIRKSDKIATGIYQKTMSNVYAQVHYPMVAVNSYSEFLGEYWPQPSEYSASNISYGDRIEVKYLSNSYEFFGAPSGSGFTRRYNWVIRMEDINRLFYMINSMYLYVRTSDSTFWESERYMYHTNAATSATLAYADTAGHWSSQTWTLSTGGNPKQVRGVERRGENLYDYTAIDADGSYRFLINSVGYHYTPHCLMSLEYCDGDTPMESWDPVLSENHYRNFRSWELDRRIGFEPEETTYTKNGGLAWLGVNNNSLSTTAYVYINTDETYGETTIITDSNTLSTELVGQSIWQDNPDRWPIRDEIDSTGVFEDNAYWEGWSGERACCIYDFSVANGFSYVNTSIYGKLENGWLYGN